MPRSQRSRRFLRGALSRLLLLALPWVLLDVAGELVLDEGPQVAPQADVRTSAPGLATPPECGEDFEDDFDDVLPHHHVVDSARASHQAPPASALGSWLLSVERPLRPPIG